MKWYKRDCDAALVGFADLTLEEVGAYNILIDVFYSRDGDLPDDESVICRFLRCRPQTWRRLKSALIGKGKLHRNSGETGAKLVVNRGETVLREAVEFGVTQSKRALKGWVLRKKDSENNDATMPLAAMPPGNANTTTTTSRDKKDIYPSSLNGHADDFAEFWAAYPRKVGKLAAQKAYAKAIKSAAPEKVLAAIEQQKSQWSDPHFIPHPATWLNRGSWDDVVEPDIPLVAR